MTLSLLAAALVAASPLIPVPVPRTSLTAEMKLSRAASSETQALRISLQLRDRAGLEALIAAQHDPASPQFRQWLTPAQFGERFGQSAADYQRLVKTLEDAGMKVRTFHNRTYLEAVGTAEQVEKLVGVKLYDVSRPAGDAFRTFQGTPKLEASLASMVLNVGGLDTRQRFHHRIYSNGVSTMGPQDLRRFYDIESLHSQGFAGQLSTVALVGATPSAAVAPSIPDVQYFYSAVSDSPATPVVDQLPGDGSGTDNEPGINVEEEMDMEMPTVAAPLMKTVTLVLAPPDNLFIGGFNEVVENLPDTTAVSTSFGGCEANEAFFGQSDITATANTVAQGVAEGIAFFDASGDSGAADCDTGMGGGTATKAVDFPSAVPYMISVGGSMFKSTPTFDADNALLAYQEEAVWNEDSAAAGGGGASTLFPQPWYQHAPGTTDGGAREVPDMALLADLSPGVAIVDTTPGVIDNDGDGTSDAAPMAAGMFALINDFIGGCKLGSPAPEMYALGQVQYTGGAAVFHDITVGNNTLDGVTGFTAGPGYDEASGLGSLDVAALAAAWPLCPTTTPVPDAGMRLQADGGPELIWNPGPTLDAGARPAYDQCAAIACDGGTVDPTLGCFTLIEGPAQCFTGCNPQGADNCGENNFCFGIDAGIGICVEGCTDNTGCAGSDAGPLCITCANFCTEPGNDAGLNGGPCTNNDQCLPGAVCIPAADGFPGGICDFFCPTDCGCGPGAQCLTTPIGSLCDQTCSVSAGGPCREGYVCNPQDTTDVGFCLPACTAQNQLCSALAPAGSTCDTSIGGVCIPPGVTAPTLTGSTSGSNSSSSGSTGGSSTTSSSSGSTAGSSSGASSAPSSGGSSAGASSGSSSGASTGSTGASTSHAPTTAGTTGSTGTSGASSSAAAKSGCGCDAGAGPDALWGLLIAASFAGSRRRRGLR